MGMVSDWCSAFLHMAETNMKHADRGHETRMSFREALVEVRNGAAAWSAKVDAASEVGRQEWRRKSLRTLRK